MQKKKIDLILYVILLVFTIMCMRGCLLVHEYEEEQRVKHVMEMVK